MATSRIMQAGEVIGYILRDDVRLFLAYAREKGHRNYVLVRKSRSERVAMQAAADAISGDGYPRFHRAMVCTFDPKGYYDPTPIAHMKRGGTP